MLSASHINASAQRRESYRNAGHGSYTMRIQNRTITIPYISNTNKTRSSRQQNMEVICRGGIYFEQKLRQISTSCQTSCEFWIAFGIRSPGYCRSLWNLAGTSKLTGLAFSMSLTRTRVTQVFWLNEALTVPSHQVFLQTVYSIYVYIYIVRNI